MNQLSRIKTGLGRQNFESNEDGDSSLDLVSDLLSHFPHESVESSELYKSIYARDGSYFQYQPKAVVRIRSASDVQALFQLAIRNHTSVTFRAAGTSLSGQTVGEGLIAEIRKDFKDIQVLDSGERVKVEPGLTVNQVNGYLSGFGVKIGPDPASKSAAMMGGVVSNNSSGMQAGVEQNAYHTLESIDFILASGNRYDTSIEADRIRFETAEKEIFRGLADLRDEVRANKAIYDKIVRKYRIKNVTGYSINSFVDFDHPIDILAHLLVGAEGTLAFIASVVLRTFPILSHHSSKLLFFKTVTEAASAVPALDKLGAVAIELLDFASLMSVVGRPGVPEFVSSLPAGSSALLVDFQAQDAEVLNGLVAGANDYVSTLDLVASTPFSTAENERSKLWAVRDGVFASVGGERPPGTTVILEDVAVDPEHLAELVLALNGLFDKYQYQGAVFGHAKAGNIHFLITDDMSSRERVEHFSRLMDEVIEEVIRLDGSLKAEHGTGRAIAPFVEKEWGSEPYSIMKRVKELLDPDCILNPGVLINADPLGHIANIKPMGVIGDVMVDKCIECGYCEHVCPTRYVTLTPRQRISAHRVRLDLIERGEDDIAREVWKDYGFAGEASCVADGMCSTVCPMGINTAYLVDFDRSSSKSRAAKLGMRVAASEFQKVEKMAKVAISAGVRSRRFVGNNTLGWGTDMVAQRLSGFPHWSNEFVAPPEMISQSSVNAEVVYFPACVSRIFGSSKSGKDSLMQTILKVASRARVAVHLPSDTEGLCCSQPWSHNGSDLGRDIMSNRIVEAMWRWTDGGRIPVMCDVTSCAKTLLDEIAETQFGERRTILTPTNRKKWSGLKIIDITEWLDQVTGDMEVTRPLGKVLLHPTCAARELGLVDAMVRVAARFAKTVVVPRSASCCGAGGNRGMLYPEIIESALIDEGRELAGQHFDGAYSLAKTCEMALSDQLGYDFESLVYLVDEATS